MKDLFRKYKNDIIIVMLVFLIIDIFIVGAFYASSLSVDESLVGLPKILKSFETVGENITNPLNNLNKIFSSNENSSGFFTLSFYFLIACIIFYIVYKIKNKKTHEYQGTEHGSSEWSVGGEEFKKLLDGTENLNRKDGFIISKNHYIGTDQRKVKINKNILVVGRIWCR